MNVYTASLKGLREQNEDKHTLFINNNGQNSNLSRVDFFGIYDGHGGKDVSTYVEENLPSYFISKDVVYPLSKKYVNNVYDFLQKALQNYPTAYRSGSTALVVIRFKYGVDDYLNVINLGDCRCVICRDNFAMPLTKDHKPNWPEERHRIEKIGGNIVFDGYDWRIKDLSVSRAFGDIDATPFLSHRPDLFRYKLDKNDKFVVMACDGLWDVMTNEEVVNFILLQCYDNTTKNRIKKQNVNIAKRLAEYAIKKGSTDNVSVTVIFFD